MTTTTQIRIGTFDGFTWIRTEGKGSFLSSPELKSFGDAVIANGERCLVVDLGACTGMDSTFMGALTGLAARLQAKGGILQIADSGEKNRRSLEDLGLDFLLELDPPSAVWRGRLEQIRSQLTPLEPSEQALETQQAKHVLDAHKTLSDVSPENARKFSDVIRLMEAEVMKNPPRE